MLTTIPTPTGHHYDLARLVADEALSDFLSVHQGTPLAEAIQGRGALVGASDGVREHLVLICAQRFAQGAGEGAAYAEAMAALDACARERAVLSA